MNYSKPKVTIDLKEYQELLQYKQIMQSHLSISFIPTSKSLTYKIKPSGMGRDFAEIGEIMFNVLDNEQAMLNEWEVKLIKKKNLIKC